MLRTMRLTAPPADLNELVSAARHAGLRVTQHGIDRAPLGWPYAGDGNAFVLVVVDDAAESGLQVEAAVRGAHLDLTGDLVDTIRFAASYAHVPDGQPDQWYATILPAVDALHDLEARLRSCEPDNFAALQGAIDAHRAALEVELAPARARADQKLETLLGDLSLESDLRSLGDC